MRALEWRDVDINGSVVRLRPEISKNKDGRVLPLRGELLAVMERAKANRRLDCVSVFHVDGKPLGDFGKAWATACKKASIAGNYHLQSSENSGPQYGSHRCPRAGGNGAIGP